MSPCAFCSHKHTPILPSGNPQSRIIAIGEAPSRTELKTGIPWSGPVGKEFDRLITRAGLDRDTLIVTNCQRCYTGTDDDAGLGPTNFHLLYNCARSHLGQYTHADTHIAVVILMGRAACSYFGLNEPLEVMHGLVMRNPKNPNQYIYPVFNPGAGVKPGGEEFHWVSLKDWSNLGESLSSMLDGSYTPTADEWPDPQYKLVDCRETLFDSLNATIAYDWGGYIAVDTENDNAVPDKPLWSVQYSLSPGIAWMIKVSDKWLVDEWFKEVQALGLTWIYHHSLHDARQLRSAGVPVPISSDCTKDTIQIAYQRNEPQGLKILARRLAGMHMSDYTDVVGKWGKATIAYLEEVSDSSWNEPGLGPRQHGIAKLAGSILKDLQHGKMRKDKDGTAHKIEVNPVDRWKHIDWDRRQVVEEVMGEISLASLSELPINEAVYYACRDADATLRVWLKQMELGWTG